MVRSGVAESADVFSNEISDSEETGRGAGPSAAEEPREEEIPGPVETAPDGDRLAEPEGGELEI